MKLNEKQRELWADKLLDLANLSLATLGFGSLVSGKEPLPEVVFLGITVYIFVAIIATRLRR